MGGAVSSGRDNDELIDNLMGGQYIRSRTVEQVFRVLDRADYMTPESRDQAYKDLAWRDGALHLSSPCIYSEVMEGLDLKPGLSFLNVGSGTGYLSTLAGLVLGSSGINHGIEINPDVVEYANKKKNHFLEYSSSLDEFDYCEPIFYTGNGLCLAPLQSSYDRVYCGAGCPEQYHNYFKQLIKVGGVLVLPLNENLLRVRRTGVSEWTTRSLLTVTFASLRLPTKEESADQIRLEELKPARLQELARACIRSKVRAGVLRRRPGLAAPPPRPPPPRRCPRRITIPIQEDAHIDHYLDGADALHDIEDAHAGADEMNALLNLVLSMSQNRVAGALRFDRLSQSDSDSDADTSDDRDDDRRDTDDDDDDSRHDDDDDENDDGGGGGGGGGGTRHDHAGRRNGDDARRDDAPSADNGRFSCRGVITFEFQNMRGMDVDVRSMPATDGHDDLVSSETEQGADEEPRAADEDEAARAGDKRPRRAPSAERVPRAAAPPPARRARRHRSLPDDAAAPRADEPAAAGGGGGGGAGGGGAGGAGAGAARRAQLSLAVRCAVRSLPLPPALRLYVNYGRRFYF